MTDRTGTARRDAQCARTLEGVHHRGLSGGQGKRPRESRDKAGRTVDLLCLDATPEQAIQRFAREIVAVHPRLSRTARSPEDLDHAPKARRARGGPLWGLGLGGAASRLPART